MEATIREEEETMMKEGEKGKRKWSSRLLTFLMYGGWLLVFVFAFGIVVLIHFLSK